MEGFLSLEQAAEQLQFSVSELSRQIEEGRVVAIVKEGRSWLSAGEVSRLKRQSERSSQPASEPEGELRLLRRSTADSPKGEKTSIFPALGAQRVDPDPSPEASAPSRPLLTFSSRPAEPGASAEGAPRPGSTGELLKAAGAADVLRQPIRPAQAMAPAPPKPVAESEVRLVPPAIPAAPPEPPFSLFEDDPPTDGEPTDPSPPAESRPIAPPPVTAVAPPPVTPAAPPPAAVVPPPPVVPSPSAVAPPAAAPIDDKAAQQVIELNRRCAELEARNQELEATCNRLKSGLQETEATLKRNRTARANLENDVISLQDQLGKARSRIEALEREIQHLGSELERTEDAHNSELRRLRSKSDRLGDGDRDTAGPQSVAATPAEMEELRNQMAEKDRLLAQEYEQRATLRSQLEDKQQKYFELKARYDKEKSEWSELLAQALQNQGHLRQQLEEMKARNPKGWNPFRREK